VLKAWAVSGVPLGRPDLRRVPRRTIKAMRDTDVVVDGRLARAGWEVLVDGIAELPTAQDDDPHSVTVTVVAGQVFARTRARRGRCHGQR
jgi:hypothetical protein